MEISESAWAKAKEIAHIIAWSESNLSDAELIARAIMDERRECAEIAEKFKESDFYEDSIVAHEISQAIRNK